MNAGDGLGRDSQAFYRRRFRGAEAYRRALWLVLCRSWFQRFVPESATVVEVGAGHCEFINAIRAGRKIAVDINPDTARCAADGVEVVLARAPALDAIAPAAADVVFMSNVLEHLERPEISATLAECLRILKPGGRLLILQPNIRYAARDYWMFFDHVTAVDDRALCEVLELTGFRVVLDIPCFLPFTALSRLPRALWLVRLYLKCPLAWRLFGGQAFVVAEKSEVGGPRSEVGVTSDCGARREIRC